MDIIKSIKDPNLFLPFIGGNLSTWKNWMTALRVLYGLKLNPNKKDIIFQCTGRDIHKLPKDGFRMAILLTGRRSGKSKISAIIGAQEAIMFDKKLIAAGETPMILILAPTRKQARIIKNYLREIFNTTALLKNEIVSETAEGFLLKSGVVIEIIAGDWRACRGYSVIACLIDELCFFGLDSEGLVKSASELVRAVKPALATTNGRMICLSSPYSKKDYAYNAYKKNFGNDNGKILIWNAPSKLMNPTLDQKIIDDALAEDICAARSEFFAEFRDDIAIFLPREIIESCVIRNRFELLHNPNLEYFAFADLSGGRGDEAALCISHKNGRKVVIDFLKRYSAPCNPYSVVANMCAEARRYRIRKVVGDNYSANFVSQAFQNNGMRYEKSELPKSQLFLNFLPIICSGLVELLDDNISVAQFSALERRTHSGGKDVVCKPQGGKDDAANVVAGVAHISSVRRLVIGAFGRINRTRCLV